MIERLFGRTKKDHVTDMILIFEQKVLPAVQEHILKMDNDDQLVAEGLLLFVESKVVEQLVKQTLNPDKPPKVKKESAVPVRVVS